MKLKIGHHIEAKNLTMEQYHAFCKKAISQGFEAGEYGKYNNHYYAYKYVGIDCDGGLFHAGRYFSGEYPDMLLTIEQALSEGGDNIAKCKIIEENKNEFKPFKIEISIDNEDDLMNLWHRMNLKPYAFSEAEGYTVFSKKMEDISQEVSQELWRILNKRANDLNIKNYQ